MYTLTPEALNILKEDQQFRLEMAKALNVSENTMYRLINANEPNGHLTKYVCISLFSEFYAYNIDNVLTWDKTIPMREIA